MLLRRAAADTARQAKSDKRLPKILSSISRVRIRRHTLLAAEILRIRAWVGVEELGYNARGS